MTGKIVAGLLGLFFGGWFGLLIGLFLGHIYDSASITVVRSGSQLELMETCFALMGRVCKADGQVTQVEIDAAEAVMTRLNIQGEIRQAAIRAFNRGKSEDFDVAAASLKLRNLCRGNPLWMRLALEIVLTGATADGRLDPAERAVLEQIGAGVGIPPAELQRLFAFMGARGAASPQRQEDRLAAAYEILGVSPSTSDAEVKKAYRRLMSQHHPDKLAARGLPEAMRRQAEEQTRRIREAWEAVQAARGL